MRYLFPLCLTLFTLSGTAQSTTLENLVLKPYWIIGEGRTLSTVTEIYYYRNDTLLQTVKGKWDGAMETVNKTNKDFTVKLVQQHVPEFTLYSPFIRDIMEYQQDLEILFRMDKRGVIEEILNAGDLKKIYVASQGRKIKMQNKGIKKTEMEAIVDSAVAAMDADSALYNSIEYYVASLLNVYNTTFPAATPMVEEVSGYTGRFGAPVRKVIVAEERKILEQKGTKYTTSTIQTYADPGLVGLFSEYTGEDKSYGSPMVKDIFLTTIDTKNGWPQRKAEETTVMYGPYKAVIKVTYKFIKD